MPQFATFLLGTIRLLELYPDHLSFLSPNVPHERVDAAIAQLVSARVFRMPCVALRMHVTAPVSDCGRDCIDALFAQDVHMESIPFEAIYGYYFGLLFSTRTRFLLKQLVLLRVMLASACVDDGPDCRCLRTRALRLFTQSGQVVTLAALKTADGSAVGAANHALAMLKAPVYALAAAT